MYGSTKNAAALWQQNGISYTLEHIHAYNQALAKGGLGIANQFKDFVLNYCKPKETMQVTLWNDTFNIECNRHKNIGDKTSMYQVYDSDSHSVKSVFHTSIKKLPDLEQFKRYFQTLMVHGLDSQVADEISYAIASDNGFIIDIHDAFIINPEDGSRVRSMYSGVMGEIRDNRHEILGNFFSSIGIGGEANEAWQQLMSKVIPLPDDFVCGPMALK